MTYAWVMFAMTWFVWPDVDPVKPLPENCIAWQCTGSASGKWLACSCEEYE